MIKLQDSQISHILPEYLSERANVQALSYALYRAAERLIDYCGNISVFASIDTAPDFVLDILAMELNTLYYDDSLPIQAKRSLIKNTLVWYMSAGTPAAVEELVAAVFGEGEVKEWFEYGGKPYYFKIVTNADMQVSGIEYFNSMISKVKNVRSHLENLEFYRMLQQDLYSCGLCFVRSQENIGWEE